MPTTSPPSYVCAMFFNERGEVLTREGRLPTARVEEGQAMGDLVDTLARETLGLRSVAARLVGVVDRFEPEHRLWVGFAARVPDSAQPAPGTAWAAASPLVDAFAPDLAKQILQDE